MSPYLDRPKRAEGEAEADIRAARKRVMTSHVARMRDPDLINYVLEQIRLAYDRADVCEDEIIEAGMHDQNAYERSEVREALSAVVEMLEDAEGCLMRALRGAEWDANNETE